MDFAMKTKNIRKQQAERYFRYLWALEMRTHPRGFERKVWLEPDVVIPESRILVPWSVVYRLQKMSPRRLRHTAP